MSYIKTIWANNTTPIDSTNLNKIEQGIYDNSLVADAVNNVVKPNDETYKDVEITEGQITDVLAVNDVLIKGQTLQDGEPTPDSPVDINVVSGSNVISTSNKNLFDGLFRQGSASTLTDTKNVFSQNNKLFKAGTYTFSTNLPNTIKFAIFGNTQKFPTANAVTYNSTFKNNITQFTFTFSQDLYLGLMIAKADNSEIIPNDISTYHFQIEQNNSATSYIAHQGKELSLDLPVENLLDKNNANIVNGYILANSTTIGDNGPSNKIVYIKIKPNTTYTVSKNNYTLNNFAIASTIEIPALNVSITNKQYNVTARDLTLTTGESDNYLTVYCKSGNEIFPDLLEKIDLQIEEGEKVNAYTPYGTTPIELCKIGDYQDYFYRDNGKWYLHKEIYKYIFTGQEDFVRVANTGNPFPYFRIYLSQPLGEASTATTILSNRYKGGTDAQLIQNDFKTISMSGNANNQLNITDDYATANDFKAFLQNNLTYVYYVLVQPTNTEITDTTLINQLEAIYNAPLYEQTNITQTNNDLPIVLDITACKDNINGIKAWIRK